MNLTKRTLLALLTLCLMNPASAWWDTGHIMVARIAQEHMSDISLQKMNRLLAAHPDPEVETLADASLWPDVIRDPNHPFHAYHRAVWHYQNRRLFPSSEPNLDGGQMIMQLKIQLEKLKDTGLSAEERAVALSWVVHLVGDIHQPLHNSSLYSKEFPAGDQGGNLYLVKLGKQELNLHALLDSVGGRFLEPIPDYRLESYIKWFQKDHSADSMSRELEVSDIQIWSDEGLDLAREIYQAAEFQRPLDASVLKMTRDISKKRLTLGSYRLARLLDSSL